MSCTDAPRTSQLTGISIWLIIGIINLFKFFISKLGPHPIQVQTTQSINSKWWSGFARREVTEIETKPATRPSSQH